MEALKKGRKVKFLRNKIIKSNNTTVVFYQEATEAIKETKATEATESTEAIKAIKAEPAKMEICIIEHAKGWKPDELRIKKFGLDRKKKYLFVNPSELTEIKKK